MVASIIGRQANLGAVSHDGPVRLRNEVSSNHGRPELRRQVIGDVNMERVNLQEGIDDNYVRSPAPRFRVNNGIRRRNVHISGFAPDHNDPSARFNNIIAGYQSMDRLTDAIANSFLPQRPNVSLRSVVQIV